MAGTGYGLLLWLPLVLALTVGLVVASTLKSGLTQAMGLPSWDFSTSWASNVSVVGGFVTVGVLDFLPTGTRTRLPAKTYGILSVIFPLIATFAPLIYNTLRKVKITTSPGGDQSVISEGRVFMFIIASVLTLWASLGQLEVQAMLIEELRAGTGAPLPSGFGFLLESIITIVGVGLLWYGANTMVDTIKIQRTVAISRSTIDQTAEGTHPRRWALL